MLGVRYAADDNLYNKLTVVVGAEGFVGGELLAAVRRAGPVEEVIQPRVGRLRDVRHVGRPVRCR